MNDQRLPGAAQTTTQIYGGGGATSAPFLRQAFDCYGVPTPLVVQGSITSGPSANETTVSETPFNYTGSPAFDCSSQHVDGSAQFNFLASSSGLGIAGLYSHDAQKYWGDAVPGSDPSGYPSVQFAFTDASLGTSDVAIYNGGGTEGSGGSAVTVAPPGGSPSSGQFVNPAQTYGALIQFPLDVGPVVLAYSPVYRKTLSSAGKVVSYSFNIHKKNADGSGGLLLTMPVVCGIFNGQITNWNDPAITALNGGVSLKAKNDPYAFNLPIELVGRVDSSGNTASFTRALAAQCTSSNGYSGTSAYVDGSKTLPSALQGPVYTTGAANNGPSDTVTPVTGKYTLASGPSGVAEYIAFTNDPANLKTDRTETQGRLGYLGPDYALPAVKNSGENTYNLNVADIQRNDNGTLVSIEPTGKSAILAYRSTMLPPESTSTGAYSAGAGTLRRANPQDWAEPITILVNGQPNPLANPANPKAYPIVGTTAWIGYTCYANATVASKVTGFLGWYEKSPVITNPTKGLIYASGFAPLPAAWQTAIVQTFVTPVAATKKLNLNITTAGSGPASGTGSQCHAVTTGG